MKIPVRMTDAAWLLLRRLDDQNAELAVCDDPDCYRFHIVARGCSGDVVRNLTMQKLVSAGLLKRSRTTNPTYVVSPKGHQALRRRAILRCTADHDRDCPTETFTASHHRFAEAI